VMLFVSSSSGAACSRDFTASRGPRWPLLQTELLKANRTFEGSAPHIESFEWTSHPCRGGMNLREKLEIRAPEPKGRVTIAPSLKEPISPSSDNGYFKDIFRPRQHPYTIKRFGSTLKPVYCHRARITVVTRSADLSIMAEQSTTTDFPTIFDPATCVRKGLCPVMAIQGQQETALQSHSVYFEQHGTGGEKIVLIMGLNTSSFAWGKQVQHFAKNHSVLVLDNRGVGNSDSPKGPYTYVHLDLLDHTL
ncbi:1625_t:CDS:2, partial [Acaulospora colombiana]